MSHFPSATLNEVCDFQNGGTPSKAVERYFTGDIPWITGADLVGPVAQNARSFITEEAITSSATNKVPAGTVLLVTRTSVGKVAIAGKELCFSQDITALLPDSAKLDAGYLVHFLRTKEDHFSRCARGATIKGITRQVVADLVIPLPPLKEQRRIAAILDQAETLRTQRRTALALLDSLTQSLFLDMFGDPAKNTLGLPTKQLGELGDWHSGGTPPRSKSHYFEGDIPWFSSGELESMYVSDSVEHISDAALKETATKLVPAGSLMMGMYDTAALKTSIALKDCSCNQAIAFSHLDPTLANTAYVYYAIVVGREHFRRLQRGVRQKNLNLSMVREIRIPHPHLPLQQTFATRIASIEALKTTHRRALAALDALFASLQQRAFAGAL
ncbi:MAG TPA: restriction endonuclease subunit S [Comamonadaceae bacterium]|nr:restriction endonuclease subunit S [Comamonadaceae bacterium]